MYIIVFRRESLRATVLLSIFIIYFSSVIIIFIYFYFFDIVFVVLMFYNQEIKITTYPRSLSTTTKSSPAVQSRISSKILYYVGAGTMARRKFFISSS